MSLNWLKVSGTITISDFVIYIIIIWLFSLRWSTGVQCSEVYVRLCNANHKEKLDYHIPTHIMVFNPFAPMSINCSSYFVLFVVILCLYFDAPCFHGLLFLQYTWIVKCIENTSTLILFFRQSEKFSKTYSNMAKLKTCSYEYGWMFCMFKTCS